MSTLLADFASIGTAIWTQVEIIGTTIMGNPLLLFTTGFLFTGGCVGIFGRLLSRN